MLRLRTTNQFERDYRKALKSGKDIAKLKHVMSALAREERLAPKHRDDKLTGNFTGRRECHVSPDWLLIYTLQGDSIIFERTGSHSELFRR